MGERSRFSQLLKHPAQQLLIILRYIKADGHLVSIVAKKWEPGNLVPSRFSAQIRKVEARLGKLAKIRKVETN